MGVGTFDVVAGPVEPRARSAGAVLVEGTPALIAAPATLKLVISLETEATALPLGCTLVEMNCKERGLSRIGLQRLHPTLSVCRYTDLPQPQTTLGITTTAQAKHGE